jgi:hypothetical protein
MTPCLRPEEFVELVDGTLPADRRTHVDGCATCHATAAELREALALAGTDVVPEPSVLFWPSINARVRAQLAPRRDLTWRRWLRWPQLVTAAGVAGVVAALGVSAQRAIREQPLPPPASPPLASAAALADITGASGLEAPDETGEAALALVVDLSRELPDGGWETLGISRLPDLAETAAALSPHEQEALAALLRSAVGRPKS